MGFVTIAMINKYKSDFQVESIFHTLTILTFWPVYFMGITYSGIVKLFKKK